MSQNRDQPEVQLHIGTFEVYVLAHVTSRISIVTILFPHQFLPPAFFVYTYKTSAFITGKCRLKVKSAGGTYQDGGNNSIWHQNGILMAYFRTCALKKSGQIFTKVGLLVDLYSVIVSYLVIYIIWFLLGLLNMVQHVVVVL